MVCIIDKNHLTINLVEQGTDFPLPDPPKSLALTLTPTVTLIPTLSLIPQPCIQDTISSRTRLA